MSEERTEENKRELSFRNPGEAFALQDISQVYHVLKEVAGIKDNPAKFAAVAANSGTHTLKLLNSGSQDHVLRITPKEGEARYFPSMNAALGAYAKILYQPVLFEGIDGARSLIDHILQPDGLSAQMEEAFANAFSHESLRLVLDGLLEGRDYVSRLHHENFPIVYVPHPDKSGESLQLTPISPTRVYSDFKSEVLPEKGSKERIRLSGQEISSKMQNISVALGGPRRRFHATVPDAMLHQDAAILRLVKGGPVPVLSSYELSERLDHLVKLHYAKIDHQNGKGYFNADMEAGLRRLARWIVVEAIFWTEEVRQQAQDLEPEFVMPELDIPKLLVAGYRRKRADRDRLAAALKDESFLKVLREELE
jgi:hypothetical protein